MTGDLVRPDGNQDPEDVEDYIREVNDELGAGAADVVALRELWYYLRSHGSVTEDDLRTVGWESSESLQRHHGTRATWWASTGRQYLALLPHIHPPDESSPGRRYLRILPDLVRPSSAGGKWRFDERSSTRPEADDEPATLSDEQLSAALDAVDVPGDTRRDRRRSTLPLQRMYRHLEERGSATSMALKEYYEPSRYDLPKQGHYRTPGAWFREVGRPIFASLPGVDPPRTLGEGWRFVGVDEATLQVDTDDDAAVEEAVAAIDVPGSGKWVDRRREVLEQAYALLREQGSVSRSALVSRVDPGDVGYSSAEAFVDEVLAELLPGLPGVEAPEGDAETWGYTRGNA